MKADTAAYLPDGPASSDPAAVSRLSSVGPKGARQRSLLSDKGKGREGDEAEGDGRGDGEEGGKSGRRRARMSQWAKRTVNSIKSLPLPDM